LTVAADRARELGLCEGVFASEEDMLASLDIANISQTELTWVDTTVYWLNRPWLTAILLIIGLIGLYFELAAPGISVAGLTAVVCFTVFFWSHMLGGTSGWLEILLFILGVTCMICELFLVPGFGVFGISGIALVALSLVMASQDFIVPDSPQQWIELRTNVVIVLGSVLGVLVLFVLQVLLLDTIPGLNRFRLAAPEGEPVAAVDSLEINRLVHSQDSAMVVSQLGEVGVAESDLRPSGKVLIGQRLLDVVTEGDYVTAGTPIEIIKIEGNRIIVRRK
jgi:membrane-bound serine protease (ClpP class)